MESFDLECPGVKFKVELIIGWYEKNGNLSIRLMTRDDGYLEPLAVLTINTGVICPKDCAYIDVNNLPEEILSWIVSNKLAVPTGRHAIRGYCEYPEFHFDAKVLQKFDPEGYFEYLHNPSSYRSL